MYCSYGITFENAAIVLTMCQIPLVATVLCLSSNVLSSAAFAPAATFAKLARCSSTTMIFSANGDMMNEDQKSTEYSGDGSEGMQKKGNSEEQQQSLTTTNPSTADMSANNSPLLGEVSVDGSFVVLAPAVVIGVVGFICSVFIAFNSGDEFVQTGTHLDSGIADQTAIQPNSDTCRGICTRDQDGLKNFMQSLRK